jgi:hypothetical protein
MAKSKQPARDATMQPVSVATVIPALGAVGSIPTQGSRSTDRIDPLEHIPLESTRFERREHAPAFESGAISCRPGESTRWTCALAYGGRVETICPECPVLQGVIHNPSKYASLSYLAFSTAVPKVSKIASKRVEETFQRRSHVA